MEHIRVFCSHRSVDKRRVKAVAERLAAAGIDPWVDQWEIQPGDDIVAKINDGLATYDVGLIFFSKVTLESAWVRGEVSTITYRAIEEGKAVIPVMLDADAPIPPLLRPRARVAGEDVAQLVEAIYGRRGKPKVAPPRAAVRERELRVILSEAPDGAVQVRAVVDGAPVAEATGALGAELRRSYRAFLEISLSGAARLGAEQAAQHRECDLVRLGEALGRAVLPGPVGVELARVLDAAAGAGETVLLAFETAATGLLSLPFEAARLPNGRIAALEPGVRVLRRHTDARSQGVAPLAGPLRILVAVGAPDEGQSGNGLLDYERELQTILDAIDHARQHGNAEVKILEVGHPQAIGDALLERGYHVLHLSGHGGAGVIALEDEDGGSVPVTPEDLVTALRASGRPVPLVFLAACLSGAGSADTAGFAQGLLAQGVPLVLAMQSSVSDWYATRLAGAFYAQLSTMEVPLASRALALARLAVEQERRAALARGERHPGLVPEYATPSLFAAGAEQPLLDRALPQEAPAPPTPPLPLVGQMPLLRTDDLIGRRPELRRLMRVLRDDPRAVGEAGRRAGMLVWGIGGVGKSALAGRVMARLVEDGWTVVAVVGRWGLGELALGVGGQLATTTDPALARIGRLLLSPELPDPVRLQQLQGLLAQHRLLLVLDNFEDNLSLAGAGFLDPATELVLTALLQAAQRGKVLITSRYRFPGADTGLADEHLGPLSIAETRKLFHRLPALAGEAPETLSLVLRHVGGHPRLLEYLDAILRRGAARLPAIAQRLREKAGALGLDPRQLGGELPEALRVGAEDILLDQLLELIEVRPEDRDALNQAAVFALPVEIAGLAFALAGAAPPTAAQVAAAEASGQRLIGTSLLTPVGPALVWVHRWTAEALRPRMGEAVARECARRAGEYLAWRLLNVSHSLVDGIEAVRQLLAATAFDRATELAWPILQSMSRYGQVVDAAGFAGEVLETLPATHPSYPGLCREEGDALVSLGATARAFQRYEEALEIAERLARAEPDRADRQWDLAVSLWRAANVEPENRVVHLQRALDIVRMLEADGRLYPEQAQGIAGLEAALEEASSRPSPPSAASRFLLKIRSMARHLAGLARRDRK